MPAPLPPGIVARDFNAESTWINAVEAVRLGCDPSEVAKLLGDLLSDYDFAEMRSYAPIHVHSDPVTYGSPTARLCWAIGQEQDDSVTWAPKIAPPSETG